MYLSSTNKPANKPNQRNLPIAVYKDPYYKYYRQAVRVLLAFVLPTIVIIFLLFLVVGFIQENTKPQPVLAQNFAFTTIPIPTGSTVASLDAEGALIKTMNIERVWVPNYNPGTGSSQAFLVNVPQGEPIAWTQKYYQQQLLDSKKWQLQKSVVYLDKVADLPSDNNPQIQVVTEPLQGQALYVQGINGQAITGLFIDCRLVTSRELHDFPDEFGAGAKIGQIYLVITKNIMSRTS